jgi:hypothetical protein
MPPLAKPTARRFYRTVIRYEVLSEKPLVHVSLSDLQELCDSGPNCGRFLSFNTKGLNGRQAALALYTAGSEPGFFRLTDDGEDSEPADK